MRTQKEIDEAINKVLANKVKVCDLCGEAFTGDTHKVYDENYNIQKGLIGCGCQFLPIYEIENENDNR